MPNYVTSAYLKPKKYFHLFLLAFVVSLLQSSFLNILFGALFSSNLAFGLVFGVYLAMGVEAGLFTAIFAGLFIDALSFGTLGLTSVLYTGILLISNAFSYKRVNRGKVHVLLYFVVASILRYRFDSDIIHLLAGAIFDGIFLSFSYLYAKSIIRGRGRL